MDNQGKKILVVEDDQFLREFYQELLQAEGYFIDVAPDGEAGFTKIKGNAYDLILLDLMLPKKDGVQILRDLKAGGGKPKNTAIVVLTNLGQDMVIKECFDLGADGYLIKSALNPDQVLQEVKSYLEKTS
ncbi:response regulator [Candidatus Daviesbacteria bacterium]|nr:response regulator [Candidatus Daviesbacteria bacterium]